MGWSVPTPPCLASFWNLTSSSSRPEWSERRILYSKESQLAPLIWKGYSLWLAPQSTAKILPSLLPRAERRRPHPPAAESRI